MKIVIQRVLQSSVLINSKQKRDCGQGFMILVGITDEDDQEDIEWITRKILGLRVFNDEEGVMNRSIIDIDGEILLISQFTLHASTKKGNRPSYLNAAKPPVAIPIYESLIQEIESNFKPIKTGEFGADMKVSLTNDGPVTIIIDSKNKE